MSLTELRQAALALPSAWDARVDDEQMFFRSMDVPSWVSIVADAPWWVQAFAATASVYVSGLISEAGKETWKNRHKIVSAVRRMPSPVSQLADFLISAQSAGSEKTFVVLEIPFPDEYNAVRLRVGHSSPEELDFSIALFVHHVPALERLWAAEGLIETRPVGGMQLELGDDCSLLVTWMDRESLERHHRVIPFGDEL